MHKTYRINPHKIYRTRKAAATAVKHALTGGDVATRHDVPRQLFIITNYRPGSSRPTWSVTEIAPIGSERFYGPFRQANVVALTESLGVEWPMSAPWLGARI